MNTNSKQNPLVMILLVVILALVAYLVINGTTKTTQVAENQSAAAASKTVHCEYTDHGADYDYNPYLPGGANSYTITNQGKKTILSSKTNTCGVDLTTGEVNTKMYTCDYSGQVSQFLLPTLSSVGATSCQNGALVGSKLTAKITSKPSCTNNVGMEIQASVTPGDTKPVSLSGLTFMIDGVPVNNPYGSWAHNQYPTSNLITDYIFPGGFSVSSGTHTETVKACDSTGCVTSAPVSFSCK